MTDLTRRNALMLTAVIAATTSTARAATAPAQPSGPTENKDLLVPPVGTVANSSIPISVKIPEKVFSQNGAVPSNVIVDMKILDANETDFAGAPSIFKVTLQGLALPPPGARSPVPDIYMMTRLKIPSDPKAAPTTAPVVPEQPADTGSTKKSDQSMTTRKVVAMIKLTYADGSQQLFNAPQSITVKNEDCSLSDVSLLRLSLQPPAGSTNAAMAVRAVVPPISASKGKTRVLQMITCSNAAVQASVAPPAAAPAPPGTAPSVAPAPGAGASPPRSDITPYFTMDVSKDQGAHLSDEVFVGFALYPESSGPIVMNWTYGGGVSNGLAASAYVVVSDS